MRTQARKAAMFLKPASDKLGQIDDATQKFIRQQILGVPDGFELADDARMRGVRQFLANTIHAPRAGSGMPTRGGFSDDGAGVAAMLATRGIQAGGLTATGLALANLTNAFTRQQTDSQIPM